MKIGDLVSISSVDKESIRGIGVYLGLSQRGSATTKPYESFLWKGRIATFDRPYWLFEVINESL